MNSKKMLLISQLGWPPEFRAQILRLSKIAKYLPLYGVEPIVIAPPPHPKSLRDEELYMDVSKYGVKVYYIGKQLHPSLNKAHLAKAFKIFLLPDLKGYMLLYLKDILRLIERLNIRYLLTSTPPSGLILGYLIKKRLRDKIKWMVDFADPWTQNHLYFSPSLLHKKFEESMEKKIVETADKLTFASKYQMKRYFQKYPELNLQHKSFWLPNGYDEEDFEKVTPIKLEKFTFLHMGTVYRQFDLSFLTLFKKFENAGYDFQLLFIGSIAPSQKEKIEKMKLKSVKILGRRQHKDIIQYLISADVLVFNMKYDYWDVFPSRLPEYLRSGVPILAFVARDSMVAEVINETKSGWVFEKYEYNKAEEIALKMMQSKVYLERNWSEIMKYDWKNIAKSLVEHMEESK